MSPPARGRLFNGSVRCRGDTWERASPPPIVPAAALPG